MNELQFAVFIDLLRRSDPWPVTLPDSWQLMEELANEQARKRGFIDWNDAYQKLKKPRPLSPAQTA